MALTLTVPAGINTIYFAMTTRKFPPRNSFMVTNFKEGQAGFHPLTPELSIDFRGQRVHLEKNRGNISGRRTSVYQTVNVK